MYVKEKFKISKEGLPGGPVVKTLALSMQGAWVASLIRKLRPHMPCGMAN